MKTIEEQTTEIQKAKCDLKFNVKQILLVTAKQVRKIIRDNCDHNFSAPFYSRKRKKVIVACTKCSATKKP